MERHNITGAGQRRSRGRLRFLLLLWAVFGAGLLVEALAPRLEIANHAFVLPPSPRREPINPAAIIARERVMQLLSAVLTVGGAIGLGVCYRRDLVRAR